MYMYRKYSNYLKYYCEVKGKEYEINDIHFYKDNEILFSISYFNDWNMYDFQCNGELYRKLKFKLDGNNFIIKEDKFYKNSYVMYINVNNVEYEYKGITRIEDRLVKEYELTVNPITKQKFTITKSVKWLDRPKSRLQSKVESELKKLNELPYLIRTNNISEKDLERKLNRSSKKIAKYNRLLRRYEDKIEKKYPMGIYF